MDIKPLLFALAFSAITAREARAALIIYESFADTNSSITGNSPGSGLTGTWSSNGFTNPGSSLSYGSQPTAGGSARYVNSVNGLGNIVATVSTLTGAGTSGSLQNAGLLADGATLWFSVMHQAVNTSDDRASFALATGGFSSNTNFGVAADQGIGFAIGSAGLLTARVSTASSTHTNGVGINRFGLASTILIVGRITWGATDTVDLYLPDTNMNLGAVQSTATAAINQSAFDVVALFTRQQSGTPFTDSSYDEIRFGSAVSDVLIPEPSSLMLSGLGLGLICFVRRVKR